MCIYIYIYIYIFVNYIRPGITAVCGRKRTSRDRKRLSSLGAGETVHSSRAVALTVAGDQRCSRNWYTTL